MTRIRSEQLTSSTYSSGTTMASDGVGNIVWQDRGHVIQGDGVVIPAKPIVNFVGFSVYNDANTIFVSGTPGPQGPAGPAGAGGGGGVSFYDDSVFKITGSAVSFDAGLSVVASGTTAYVNGYTFDAATTTAGFDQNRNTSSSFTFQMGFVSLFFPTLVHQIIWDIRQTGTYRVYIADFPGSTGTIYPIVESQAVGPAGEITFTPTNGDFILGPGSYWFALQRLTGATTWSDYNNAYSGCSLFTTSNIYYDATQYSFTLPMKIVGHKGHTPGFAVG